MVNNDFGSLSKSGDNNNDMNYFSDTFHATFNWYFILFKFSADVYFVFNPEKMSFHSEKSPFISFTLFSSY